jgi:uncharacterized protein with HEPN domain
MRDDRERLADILEAVERIEKYAARGRAAFDQDELLQVWIVHHLLIIGEACFAMSGALKAGHPEVPWRQITGMRHILIHQYFGIDKNIVWSVVEKDLRDLKQKVTVIAASLGAP